MTILSLFSTQMFTTTTSPLLLPIIHSSFLAGSKDSKGKYNIGTVLGTHSIITKFISSFFLLLSRTGSNQKKETKDILLSQIQLSSTSNKIIISFYYYHSSAASSFEKGKKASQSSSTSYVQTNKEDMNKLELKELSRCSAILSTILEKEVEIRATLLFYPYMNSTILAHYLVKNSASNTFLHFQESILSYPSFHVSTLPSSILGMKIQLAGRITTEAVVPRLTVKSTILGSFKNGFIEKGFCTTKNKLGAFTIKVWIATQA